MVLDITRTRTKRYVGVCGIGDCDFTTNVESVRVNVGVKLRDHARTVHGLDPEFVFPKGASMKQPGKELPAQEKLSDYIDHYIVVTDGKWGERDTSRGKAVTVEALVYVFIDSGWKSLGDTPIFWSTVQKQVMEDTNDDGNQSEPLGGKLTKGTERNANEFAIVAVPASDKAGTKALNDWSKDKAEPF